jgi:hypothetical protein
MSTDSNSGRDETQFEGDDAKACGDCPDAMAVDCPDCGGHKHCSLDSLVLARGIMSDCSERVLSVALLK